MPDLAQKQTEWSELAAKVFEEVEQWRKEYPQATFENIEQAIDQRLARLRTQMLKDSSQATTLEGEEADPLCEECGVKLHRRGKQVRRLITELGRSIELERDYLACPQCGVGLFPLDEKLGLWGSVLSPSLQRKLVQLSNHLPFRVAVALLQDFFGVAISRETARRLCEGAGALYLAQQSAELAQLEAGIEPSQATRAGASEAMEDHAQISADGAMVSLVGGEWCEVRTLAIGAVSAGLDAQGEAVTHCHQLSYFSRLAQAEQFGSQATVEIMRRGVSESVRVSAVVDGAEWLQGFIDLHCPKATRILDFPHAAQRVAGIGEAIWGSGSAEAKNWLAQKLHQLKHEHKGASALLEELEQLQLAHPTKGLVLENLNYLKQRQGQME